MADDKRLLVWAGIAEVQVLLHFFFFFFFPEVCEAASCFPHEPVYIEFNNEPNFQHKLICDFL